MSKVLSTILLILAAFTFAYAQEQTRNSDDPPSQGIAPKIINGVGRADVRVRDENGNPIKDVYVKLESTRTDGYFCESWDNTNDRGITVLPPIHMGSLKLKIKAKGYQSQEIDVPADQLGDPVRITLKKK